MLLNLIVLVNKLDFFSKFLIVNNSAHDFFFNKTNIMSSYFVTICSPSPFWLENKYKKIRHYKKLFSWDYICHHWAKINCKMYNFDATTKNFSITSMLRIFIFLWKWIMILKQFICFCLNFFFFYDYSEYKLVGSFEV